MRHIQSAPVILTGCTSADSSFIETERGRQAALFMNSETFPVGRGEFNVEGQTFVFEKKPRGIMHWETPALETMRAVYNAFTPQQKISLKFKGPNPGTGLSLEEEIEVALDLSSDPFLSHAKRKMAASAEDYVNKRGNAVKTLSEEEANVFEVRLLAIFLNLISQAIKARFMRELDKPRSESTKVTASDLESDAERNPQHAAARVLTDGESDPEVNDSDRNSPSIPLGSVPRASSSPSFFSNPEVLTSNIVPESAKKAAPTDNLAWYLVVEFLNSLLKLLLNLCSLYETPHAGDYPPVVFRC